MWRRVQGKIMLPDQDLGLALLISREDGWII
jgi:hypothetical protein